MATEARFGLPAVEERACDLVEEHAGLARGRASPGARVIENPRCDVGPIP